HSIDVPVTLIAMGGKPIQVKAVGVELAGSRGDERLGLGLDAVEQAVDGVEPLWREPVLVVAEVQNRDVIGDFEVCGHLFLLTGRTGWPPPRPPCGAGCRRWVAWACAASGRWAARRCSPRRRRPRRHPCGRTRRSTTGSTCRAGRRRARGVRPARRRGGPPWVGRRGSRTPPQSAAGA